MNEWVSALRINVDPSATSHIRSDGASARLDDVIPPDSKVIRPPQQSLVRCVHRRAWSTAGIIPWSTVVLSVHRAAVHCDPVVRFNSPPVCRRLADLRFSDEERTDGQGRSTRTVYRWCACLAAPQRPPAKSTEVWSDSLHRWKKRTASGWSRDHFYFRCSHSIVTGSQEPRCHSRPTVDIWPARQ